MQHSCSGTHSFPMNCTFADIKKAAELKQEANTEETTSLLFQEGFAIDIPGE